LRRCTAKAARENSGMRAYELRATGLENLVLVERPQPNAAAGEVVVRMRAASLNYRDLLVAKGRYGRGTPKFPLVPLSDGAGEVVEVGAGVERVKRGERVVGSFFRDFIDGPPDEHKRAAALGGNVDGVLAEYVALRADAVVPLPAELSFERAATLPCAGVTAWVGLVTTGQLEAGETVLAMGTGGVSIFALQIAKALGARVILTSSSDEKLERGQRLGADHVINYRHAPDWDRVARELTGGRGVDQILEVGGAETLAQSQRALRDGGHLALIGLLTGTRAEPAIAAAPGRGLRVDPIYVGSTADLRALVDTVVRLRLQPVVDRAFGFEAARQAYECLESGRHFGKLVITI
jgi:NADPH:quinone reductase-like Zn-dependent oxidoreductase